MILKNKIIRNILEIAAIVVAYLVLFHYVASNDVISHLLTAGNKATKLEMAISLLFVILRFITIILLPGIVLAMAGSLLMEYFGRKKNIPVKD